MFNRGFMNIIIGYGVLQLPLGTNGEENTLCYIRKNAANTGVCVPPKHAQCCSQQLSVDRIGVYGKETCTTPSYCGTGKECCESSTILSVSAEYIASLKNIFRRTNCFNNLTLYQLPNTNALVYVVVSYSCIATTTSSATTIKAVIPTASATTTLSATSTSSASSATSASNTASTQPQPKTIQDGTSNVVIALAVSLSIVSVAFVVVVTVMFLRRNQATPQTSMAKANGIVTMTRDPVQASTSGTQYVNVVPPTYEQLSRQHTDGEYSELF